MLCVIYLLLCLFIMTEPTSSENDDLGLRSARFLWIPWSQKSASGYKWADFITHKYDTWSGKILTRGFWLASSPLPHTHTHASHGFLPRIKLHDQFCCHILLIISEINKPLIGSKKKWKHKLYLQEENKILKLSWRWQTRFAFQCYYKPWSTSPCEIAL